MFTGVQIFFATPEILENWGISITEGQSPVVQSRDVFSPIVRERNYLMDRPEHAILLNRRVNKGMKRMDSLSLPLSPVVISYAVLRNTATCKP